MISWQLFVSRQVVFTSITPFVKAVTEGCTKSYKISIFLLLLIIMSLQKEKASWLLLSCTNAWAVKYQWVSASGSFQGGKREGQAQAVAQRSPPATELSELSTHPRSTKFLSHLADVHVALKHLQEQSEIFSLESPSIPSPGVKLVGMDILGRQHAEDNTDKCQYLCRQRAAHLHQLGHTIPSSLKVQPRVALCPMGWAYLPNPSREAVSPAISPASQHLPRSQHGMHVLPSSQKWFHSPSFLQWQPPRCCPATSTPATSSSCFWPWGSPSNPKHIPWVGLLYLWSKISCVLQLWATSELQINK